MPLGVSGTALQGSRVGGQLRRRREEREEEGERALEPVDGGRTCQQ